MNTNVNTTTFSAKFTPQAINGMGIADIKGHVSTGVMSEAEAVGILHSRIQKRIAEKRNLIPSIVEFHNELAAKLGLASMVVASPGYPAKRASIIVSGNSQADIDKLAADIVSSNVDIPLLMSALGQLLQQKAP